MRELAVQASTDSLTSLDRSSLDQEYGSLRAEIARIKDATRFNNRALIDGTLAALNLQVGVDDTFEDRIVLSMRDASMSAGAIFVGEAVQPTPASPGFLIDLEGGREVPVPRPRRDGVSSLLFQEVSAIARANAINIDTRIHGVTADVREALYTAGDDVRGGDGQVGDFIWFDGGPTRVKIDLLGVRVEERDASGTLETIVQAGLDRTYIPGTYTADTSSGKLAITAEDGRSFELRMAGNAGSIIGEFSGRGQGHGSIVLSSDRDFAHNFGVDWGFGGELTEVKNADITSEAINNVRTIAAASTALSAVDNSLQFLSQERATLGALQNRLGITIDNLSASRENLLAATSRIRDADYARETAEITRAQILQQFTTSLLAQANRFPQLLLQLL
jgi:flagellin